MDSVPNTNRKGFIKRAGLAFAGIFALSSTTGHSSKSKTQMQQASQTQPRVMARVQTAKGAVARKS